MALLNISYAIRKGLVVSWLVIVFIAIGLLFWYNEWVYNLPTPIPDNHIEVKLGTTIDIDSKFLVDNNKPVFIHFYNPNCPCSRFNVPHVKSLIKKYGSKVFFAIVVLNEKEVFATTDIQEKFGAPIPIVFDKDLAISCGVYATPQAVILDSDHHLYYKGNYNKSRYCTDKNTNYAQMAIDSLLNKNTNPIFNSSVLKAYGCELPKCNKP